MKILQLVTKRQFRGAEVFAANLSEKLIAHGVKLLFVGLYCAPDKELTVDGALNADLNGKKQFLSFSLIRKLSKLIQSENPDVIQANGSDTLKYAVISRWFAGRQIPVVYRNISMVSVWVGESFVKKKFYAFLFSRVDFITSVGENSINDLVKLFNFPRQKTRVIRRGIPITPLDKAESRRKVLNHFDLPTATKLVVHVGSFSIEKNHEFLLSVFSDFKESHPDIKLILVGDGDLFGFIEQKINELNLRETVYLAGFRKDVGVFLSAANLVVLCSKVEGIPGVILEAAAQRTPSLAIDVGGVREVVQHNETGILQVGFDTKSFCNTLTKLILDPKKLNYLGEKAFSFVQKNFDTEENTLKFLQLYGELTNRG